MGSYTLHPPSAAENFGTGTGLYGAPRQAAAGLNSESPQPLPRCTTMNRVTFCWFFSVSVLWFCCFFISLRSLFYYLPLLSIEVFAEQLLQKVSQHHFFLSSSRRDPLYFTSKNDSKRKKKMKKEEMESQAQLRQSRVLKVDSEESWEFFLNQAKTQACPIVVHFTASWCVPSVAMNNFYEDLALNYQDIFFLLVDIDEVKAVASKMEVKAMPTFLFLKDGIQKKF